jgi:hypothetical protein
MAEQLPPVVVTRRRGTESFHVSGKPLPHTLHDFWAWSTSDLVSNVSRGRLAEFLVATALGIDVGGVRNEWDAFDLTTANGLKVEVKSAAYVQRWYQKRFSEIVWRTPRTRFWDASTNVQSGESRRHADVYVLTLLHHQDKSTIDPLDLAQWSFFVVPSYELDARARSQHSITLNSVKDLVGGPVSYVALSEAVAAAGHRQRAAVSRAVHSEA